MSEVKWIKIVTDIFDDEKMLLIESLPSADSIIVIWFKLLCLAGKNNNNGVFLMNDKIEYTEEMLATIFRRDVNTVRLALKTFESYGMVEIIDGVYTIPNWGKHQNLDKLEKKTDYMRNYMKEYREKQKKKIECKSNCKTNSKSNVSRAEEDIDIDKDIELDKDKEEEHIERDKDNINLHSDKKEIIKRVVNYLNNRCGTRYRHTTESTVKHINARLTDGYTEEDFYIVIDKKAKEWIGTEYERYLRPETLFCPKNFESYLNQKIVEKREDINSSRKSQLDYLLNSIREAEQNEQY